jgi:heme-degrading monooxygenase HmoA
MQQRTRPITAILIITTLAIVFTAMRGRAGERELIKRADLKLVARVWSGKVKASKADEYHQYLKQEGADKIAQLPGSMGVQLMRRDGGNAVEFIVTSFWADREAIKAYFGPDIEKPKHLPLDKQYLIELPTRVKVYDVTIQDRIKRLEPTERK